MSDKLIMPKQHKDVDTIWLAYPILLRKITINKNKLQIFLEENNIQTRPIFSGNITRQPILKNENILPITKSLNLRIIL